MLQPTAGAACSPVSAYPPREKWVPGVAAYSGRCALPFLHTHLVERWVGDVEAYRSVVRLSPSRAQTNCPTQFSLTRLYNVTSPTHLSRGGYEKNGSAAQRFL